MEIGGIGHYSGVNSYSVRDIPKADIQQTKRQNIQHSDEQKLEPVQVWQKDQDTDNLAVHTDQDSRRKSADLENISLTFDANGNGPSIGKDSDILSLDMQKAISDMKKDQVLADYQYFVGSAQNLKEDYAGLDGIVIQKY